MDETWVRKYHNTKKGIAPVGTARRGIKSGKCDRLIVVDAISNDGPLSSAGAEMAASFHDDVASKSSSRGSNESLRYGRGCTRKKVITIMPWTMKSFKTGSTNILYRLGKGNTPEVFRCFVLDNAPYQIGGMRNPFVMMTSRSVLIEYAVLISTKFMFVVMTGCLCMTSRYLREDAILPNKSPRGLSTEEFRQTGYDTMEDYEPHLPWMNWNKVWSWRLDYCLYSPLLMQFQPIELFWASIMNSIGRRHFKGRDMAWIASKLICKAGPLNRLRCSNSSYETHWYT